MAALYRSRGYQTKAINGTRLSSRRSSAADRQSVKLDYILDRHRGIKVLPPHGAWVTEAREEDKMDHVFVDENYCW